MQVERELAEDLSEANESGGRVSNTWTICLVQGDSSEKLEIIPHKTTAPHGAEVKTQVAQEEFATD